MKKEIIFIDFENIQNIRFRKNKNVESHIVLFVGSKQSHINIDTLVNLTSGATFKVIKVNHGRKNALDFYLAVEMGRYHEREDIETKFKVVSNDRDFDTLVEYFKRDGRDVELVSSRDKMPQSNRDTDVMSRKIFPYSYKEQESYSGDFSLSNRDIDMVRGDQIINHFENSNSTRASRLETLHNQIASHFKRDGITPDEVNSIIDYLKKIGYIAIDQNNRVLYTHS